MPEGAGSGTRGAWFPRWFWPSFAAPAALWLIGLFVVPFYVIVSIAFGDLDPKIQAAAILAESEERTLHPDADDAQGGHRQSSDTADLP